MFHFNVQIRIVGDSLTIHRQFAGDSVLNQYCNNAAFRRIESRFDSSCEKLFPENRQNSGKTRCFLRSGNPSTVSFRRCRQRLTAAQIICAPVHRFRWDKWWKSGFPDVSLT